MKKRIFVYTFVIAFLFGACKESFFDINDNPNKPSEESITSNFLMTSVVANTVKRSTTNFDFLAHWMGYWARGSSFGVSVPLENYNITSSYQANQWQGVTPDAGWYDILMDNHIMEQKAKESGEEFYVGVAKVMKSIGFMYLVDLYNNVPYSEAFDVVNHLTPGYDKGEDIYKDLLLQLDTARSIFAQSGLEVSEEMQNADIVFGGDVDMWRKLTNTQALRLLIHQSEKVTNPTDEIAKITNDGVGFLSVGETAWVNPGYSNDQYKLNPMYIAFVRDHNGTLVDGFNRANNYLLGKYRDNDDIRYQYVFLPAVNSKPSDDESIRWDGNDFGQSNESGKSSANESIVMGTGLVPNPESPTWLFTSVESIFLQAEAAQRGWIGEDAHALYELAVNESFSFLKVNDAADEASTYLTKSVASWSSASDKLELIINQKYLALPGIANFEAWTDYRRLGFPTDVPLTLNSSRNGREIPLRLQYPQNEFNYNAKNVEAEGNIDPQKDGIWWDVN